MSKLSAVVLTLVMTAMAALMWQSANGPDEATGTASSEVPRYRIDNLRALRTDSTGLPLVRLSAETANYFDDGAAALTNIETVGLSGEAAPWALKSPAGTVTAGEKRLLLQAPVTGTGRWTTGEPFTFVGSAVWVDDAKRQFYSSEPLTLESESRTARAKGFTAGFDGKTLKMTQPELSYVLGE
ncbi:MAG: LPS export ABC transporter periplasmic protein LptC [Pseudomonadota bacterium]